MSVATNAGRRILRSALPTRVQNRIAEYRPAQVAVPQGTFFRMNTDNGDGIAKALWWAGLDAFEPETMRVWRLLAHDASFVMDIGANTGIYAMLAASLTTVPVIALEPLPRAAAELRRNVDLNRFTNVTVLEAAASFSAGTAKLFVPAGDMTTESSLREGFREADEVLEVPTVTVDGLVAEHGLSGRGIIKIDTEATEHLVLGGAVETLRVLRPVFVVEVLANRTEAQLTRILEANDYCALWLGAPELPCRPVEGDNTYKLLNWLFVPSERLEEVRNNVIGRP